MYKQFLPLNLDLPKTCGAKTRRGTPCKNAPRIPSLRCSKHGGKTPIKHGRRTKYTTILNEKEKQIKKDMTKLEKILIRSIENQEE